MYWYSIAAISHETAYSLYQQWKCIKQETMTKDNSDTMRLKRDLLSQVYEVYEQITERFDSACKRDCYACCTSGVIATTLEILPLAEFLEQSLGGRRQEPAQMVPDERKPRPTLTINHLARCCLERIEPPQDETVPLTAPCPLRGDDGCRVYEVRPFQCRSMFSTQICKVGGEAVMDPVIISLNGVFEQIIEHIDHGGLVGNILDLLAAFEGSEFRESYRRSVVTDPDSFFLRAQPNPGFIVLPQHRQEVAAALTMLWEKKVQGLPFREAMNIGKYSPMH
jgi:hypothetical protein